MKCFRTCMIALTLLVCCSSLLFAVEPRPGESLVREEGAESGGGPSNLFLRALFIQYGAREGVLFGLSVMHVPDDAMSAIGRPRLLTTDFMGGRKTLGAGIGYERWSDDLGSHTTGMVSVARTRAYYFRSGDYLMDGWADRYDANIVAVGMSRAQRLQGPLRIRAMVHGLNLKKTGDGESGLLEQDRPVGAEGGFLLSAGLELDLDSRDHGIDPTTGKWWRIGIVHFDDDIAGDFGLTRWGFDLRSYVSLGENWTGAFRFRVSKDEGVAPFFASCVSGLRGLTAGGSAVRAIKSFEAELRGRISDRWMFVGYGGVMSAGHDLDTMTWNDREYTVGGGFRRMMLRRIRLYMSIEILQTADRTQLVLGQSHPF